MQVKSQPQFGQVIRRSPAPNFVIANDNSIDWSLFSKKRPDGFDHCSQLPIHYVNQSNVTKNDRFSKKSSE